MVKTIKKILNKKIRRILIAAFCLLVAAGVAFVMFFLYTPSMNAMGALSSVCMDIICMVILFIIIGSFAFGNYGTNRTTRWFALLLLATVWATFLDFLNWAFDGSLEVGDLTYWFTVGSLCMGSVLAGIFCVYIYSYMNEMHGLKAMRKKAIVCVLLNGVSFVVTFILALTRTAFIFVDGHYEVGALYDVVTVIPVLTLLFFVVYSIYYVKTIGIHDIFAVTGYILFMVFGALIESSYRIGTTYVAVSIADIFIFVMLQNEIIAREKRNVEKYIRMSNTDELTGFYNRHAYEQALVAIESGKEAENLVYVSCDVNELKTVNDTLGHSAGDELIIGAAECLNKCFGPFGKLYRIGGDEFVAIVSLTDAQLAQLKNEINETASHWKGNFSENLTVSCGYASLSEIKDKSVKQMVSLADKRMYAAKANYYKTAGIERRNRKREISQD